MRWSTGLRKAAAALALSVGVGALATLSAAPSQAEGPYWFRCTGPLAPADNVAVAISLSSREPAVGEPLVVRWQLGVQTPLKVPDPFNARDLDEGGHLAITGRVRAHGVWTGQGDIDATDTRFLDAERLREDENLELGTLADGQVIASRAGNGHIEIGSLVIDLAPAVSVWNNDFTAVGDFSSSYPPSWARETDSAPYGDKFHIEQDVRESDTEGAAASFTFTGTSVDLITDRFNDMSRFELTVDDGFPPVEYRETHDAYWPVAGDRRLHETFPTIELPYGKYTVTVKNRIEGKFARVDAFRVHSSTANNLAVSPYRTVCSPAENVPLIPITVTEGGSTGSPDPSGSPTDTEDPDDTPTPTPSDPDPSLTPTPTNGNTGTPTNGTGNGGDTNGGNLVGGVLVTTTVSGTPRPTRTATATVTASPQVRITPVGAAQTGEAPAPTPPPGPLVAAGAALLAGGLLGGVALRRRRAAHAGDRPRPTS